MEKQDKKSTGKVKVAIVQYPVTNAGDVDIYDGDTLQQVGMDPSPFNYGKPGEVDADYQFFTGKLAEEYEDESKEEKRLRILKENMGNMKSLIWLKEQTIPHYNSLLVFGRAGDEHRKFVQDTVLFEEKSLKQLREEYGRMTTQLHKAELDVIAENYRAVDTAMREVFNADQLDTKRLRELCDLYDKVQSECQQ